MILLFFLLNSDGIDIIIIVQFDDNMEYAD